MSQAIPKSHPTTKRPQTQQHSGREGSDSCACLIQGDVGGVREVQRGHKQVHIVTVQTALVNVLRDDLAGKIFAGAGPPVEGEGERFLGLWVAYKSRQGI